MNISLKKQIVLAFLIIILSITGLYVLSNRYLLDDYYLNSKEDLLFNTANNINDNIEKLQDIDFLNSLERDCNIQNLSMVIVNDNYSTMVSLYSKEDTETILKRIKMNIADKDFNQYKISEIQSSSLAINYLEIVGKFDNGYYYSIKTPIDSIKSSAALSTVFLVYILVFLLPLSVTIILILTDRITQPLTKLTKVSSKIANLDFSEKCEPEGSSEIVALSKNFNTMSDKLEQTIGELKTANTQLQEDLEKKEKLEEMRKEFLSSVSHELKTPIAIISGYAESLKDSIEDPEDISFYADTIYEETQKLSKMVKQILDINKLEYQSNNVSIVKVDLFNLINKIITPMQKVLDDKQVTFKNKIPEDTYIWTDMSMFTHIISNYITNAIDYVNKNGIIAITLTQIDNKYKINVFNTGSHIPEDSLDRVWEKFFKVDKARSREFGGTGLGLAIVKSYAKTLKQEHGVCNKSNGVEFYITAEK